MLYACVNKSGEQSGTGDRGYILSDKLVVEIVDGSWLKTHQPQVSTEPADPNLLTPNCR